MEQTEEDFDYQVQHGTYYSPVPLFLRGSYAVFAEREAHIKEKAGIHDEEAEVEADYSGDLGQFAF